jgi:hypothetical protein
MALPSVFASASVSSVSSASGCASHDPRWPTPIPQCKKRIKKLQGLMRNDSVDLWSIDAVHFQQHGSRCRMWIPPESPPRDWQCFRGSTSCPIRSDFSGNQRSTWLQHNSMVCLYTGKCLDRRRVTESFQLKLLSDTLLNQWLRQFASCGRLPALSRACEYLSEQRD